jgi:hypothetical protein
MAYSAHGGSSALLYWSEQPPYPGSRPRSDAPLGPENAEAALGNFTPSRSQIRTCYSRLIRLVPSPEGCRLPLNIGILPSPVDPSQMAMTRSLRSTGITPASSLLRRSPPLPGASLLMAPRFVPLAPLPLTSPIRFSHSVQEPDWTSRRLHAGCRSSRLPPPELTPGEGSAPVFDIV